MKRYTPHLLLTALIITLAACVSAPGTGAATDRQQVIAAAVEDALAIGLVPVLTKNPSYLGAARTVAAGLGSFTGDTLTPEDVTAFLAKVPGLAPEDARAIAGIVNAAWATYVKRYSAQVNASVRPDVKLFLAAVANGINSAIAATPKP